MALQTVSARSGGLVGTFELDWETHRWTSQSQVHFEEGDFPFVAEIGKGRFELYSDHTFGEAEVGDGRRHDRRGIDGDEEHRVVDELNPRARERFR